HKSDQGLAFYYFLHPIINDSQGLARKDVPDRKTPEFRRKRPPRHRILERACSLNRVELVRLTSDYQHVRIAVVVLVVVPLSGDADADADNSSNHSRVSERKAVVQRD